MCYDVIQTQRIVKVPSQYSIIWDILLLCFVYLFLISDGGQHCFY